MATKLMMAKTTELPEWQARLLAARLEDEVRAAPCTLRDTMNCI